MNIWIVLLMIVMTLCLYVLASLLYKHVRVSVLIPVLTTTFMIVVILLLTHTSYSTYMGPGEWISKLMGPAVVALAYPLYRQRHLFKQYGLSILGSALIGVVVGMLSGVGMALVLGFSEPYIISIIPKSVTTPVALQISNNLGGEASLTSVFVMIAGFTGVILGLGCLKLFRVKNAISVGIALGISSHALGTAKALEHGEIAVSMGSLALTISAIVSSFIGPLILVAIYH